MLSLRRKFLNVTNVFFIIEYYRPLTRSCPFSWTNLHLILLKMTNGSGEDCQSSSINFCYSVIPPPFGKGWRFIWNLFTKKWSVPSLIQIRMITDGPLTDKMRWEKLTWAFNLEDLKWNTETYCIIYLYCYFCPFLLNPWIRLLYQTY